MRRLVRMLLTSVAALGTIAGTIGSAEAAFTFTFQEQGTDVVVIGSGSVDLAGLSWIGEGVLPARASAHRMLSPAMGLLLLE